MILILADLCTMDHDPDPTIVLPNSTWPMILISVVDSFGPWAGRYPLSGTGKAVPPPCGKLVFEHKNIAKIWLLQHFLNVAKKQANVAKKNLCLWDPSLSKI